MKTVRALKITSILNGIFCFFCIASTLCFAINRYFDLREFFHIGNTLVYGWMLNPVGIVSFAVCLVLFLKEIKIPEAKQAMGKRWIWMFVWPVVIAVFYVSAIIFLVSLTGGV